MDTVERLRKEDKERELFKLLNEIKKLLKEILNETKKKGDGRGSFSCS